MLSFILFGVAVLFTLALIIVSGLGLIPMPVDEILTFMVPVITALLPTPVKTSNFGAVGVSASADQKRTKWVSLIWQVILTAKILFFPNAGKDDSMDY